MPYDASHASHEAAAPRSKPPIILGTDSTVQELPLSAITLKLEATGQEAAHCFNRWPDLPGIFLQEQTTIIGVISRYRFLDYLLRPKGCELFLSEPLSVLYSYARTPPLIVKANTSILEAARLALRRPTELQGEPIWVCGLEGDRLLNAQELNRAYWQIRGIETQVRHERIQAAILQNQKMAALGRLVDGVSHEILDPLGFIWGNLRHVSHYCQQLLDLLDGYAQLVPDAELPADLKAKHEDIELAYLKEDLPDALKSIHSGAARLKQLATSLQNFCHIDEVYPKPADLHELIDSIVLLLKSRLTTKILVVREYDALPPVPCFAGQLSQVFMNVLSRCVDTLLCQATHQQIAADLEYTDPTRCAIAASPLPTITIRTQIVARPTAHCDIDNHWATITIEDNGLPLSPAESRQIQADFSVQQRLERETDLATSYRIITAKHGGTFEVTSGILSNDEAAAAATGTRFSIQIPLYGQATSA